MTTRMNSVAAERLGTWMKTRFSESGITLAEFCRMTGLLAGTVSHWTTGISLPKVELFYVVCKALTQMPSYEVAAMLRLPERYHVPENVTHQAQHAGRDSFEPHRLNFDGWTIEVLCRDSEAQELGRFFLELSKLKSSELVDALREHFPYTKVVAK